MKRYLLCLALAGALYGIAMASGSDPSPLQMPATWVRGAGGHETYAMWKNGASTFRGDVIPGQQTTTEDLLDTLWQTRVSDPTVTGTRREQLHRCSSTLGLTTTTRTGNDGVTHIAEHLDYVNEGAWYFLHYDRATTAPDPAIEQILHATCPDDIPFASLPAGWSGDPGGLWAMWEPAAKAPVGQFATVQLTASGSDGSPLSAASVPPSMLQSPNVRTATACEIPLLVADGTMSFAGTKLRSLVVISQFGSRRYTVQYLHAGSEDPAVRAALMTLCAKNPFPAKEWLGLQGPLAQVTPSPRVDLSIRLPHAFRATLTTTYAGVDPPLHEQTLELYAANGARKLTSSTTRGSSTTTTERIFNGPDDYDLVNGTWYKSRSTIVVKGGMYPNFAIWRGTVTRDADETAGGVTLEVYHVADPGRPFTVWIGQTDRYIRRYEERYDTPQFGHGAYALQRLDFASFDEAIAVDAPTLFTDASACSTGVIPPRPLGPVQPVFPANGPRLTAEVSVDVLVSVAADGRLTNASIAKSSGYPALDDAAERAVRKASFSAPTIYCTPGAGEATYRLLFSP
jgi:TonB family protein